MARGMGVAALCAGVLATLGSPGVSDAGNPSGAAISLTQTAMIDTGSDVCGAQTSLTVAAGTTVRFCYTVLNTGSVTLDSHTAFGDFDGAVLTDFAYSLAPGASAFMTSTEVINADTTNLGTWIATNDANDMAQSTSSLTVTLLDTQHSASGVVSSVVNAQSACSLNIQATVDNGGDNAATFTIHSATRPAGVGFSSVTTYIGFPEGNFAFDDFDVPLGGNLNGTYTFTVTKTSGDGTNGVTNPITVTVEVTDLPACGQHAATVSLSSSSACSLNLAVQVLDGSGDVGTYTVNQATRPAGISSSTVTTYIGFPAGSYAFDNFTAEPGESLNGTYTFTVTKTAGTTGGIENPITVEYVVSGLPTCGVRVIIEKTTNGGAGGPFQFTVREGVEGENLVAEPSGSTSEAGTPTEMYDEYLPAGFYRVAELFTVGDPSDTSTWDAGDGFFPGEMLCTVSGLDGESENTAQPTSNGITGLGSNLENGETMHCFVENDAPASITISKSSPSNELSPSFAFTGDFAFDLAVGESQTFDSLEAGGYEFTEAETAGWSLTSIDCGEADYKVDLENGSIFVGVDPGDTVECEFVNTADEVTPTTDDNGSGNPTTTRSRGLPATGGAGSITIAVLALGLVFVGTALAFTRRRATR